MCACMDGMMVNVKNAANDWTHVIKLSYICSVFAKNIQSICSLCNICRTETFQPNHLQFFIAIAVASLVRQQILDLWNIEIGVSRIFLHSTSGLLKTVKKNHQPFHWLMNMTSVCLSFTGSARRACIEFENHFVAIRFESTGKPAHLPLFDLCAFQMRAIMKSLTNFVRCAETALPQHLSRPL